VALLDHRVARPFPGRTQVPTAQNIFLAAASSTVGTVQGFESSTQIIANRKKTATAAVGGLNCSTKVTNEP